MKQSGRYCYYNVLRSGCYAVHIIVPVNFLLLLLLLPPASLCFSNLLVTAQKVFPYDPRLSHNVHDQQMTMPKMPYSIAVVHHKLEDEICPSCMSQLPAYCCGRCRPVIFNRGSAGFHEHLPRVPQLAGKK